MIQEARMVSEFLLLGLQVLLCLLGWFAVAWVRAELRSLKNSDEALAARIGNELVAQRGQCAEHTVRMRVLEEGANDRRVRIATLEAHYQDLVRRLDSVDDKLEQLLSYQRSSGK